MHSSRSSVLGMMLVERPCPRSVCPVGCVTVSLRPVDGCYGVATSSAFFSRMFFHGRMHDSIADLVHSYGSAIRPCHQAPHDEEATADLCTQMPLLIQPGPPWSWLGKSCSCRGLHLCLQNKVYNSIKVICQHLYSKSWFNLSNICWLFFIACFRDAGLSKAEAVPSCLPAKNTKNLVLKWL